jgi:tetratricopeptide (TPR) repeat protein
MWGGNVSRPAGFSTQSFALSPPAYDSSPNLATRSDFSRAFALSPLFFGLQEATTRMSKTRWNYYVGAAALGLILGAADSQAQGRFDHLVRNDFFAGMLGDREALDRAMEKCEEILKDNPNHVEAMVWRGAGVFYLAGREFQQGDREKGMALYTNGLSEMDKAVELAPDHIGVRIPRGAALMGAARAMPEENPVRKGLLERARDDHQRAFDLQKDHLDRLGAHPLGELLFALADVNSRLGDTTRADLYYEMILSKLKGSPYAKRADLWKQTRRPLPLAQTNCIGCHTPRAE